jgi:tetratricopeptide (TPR) repeat protein
MAGQIDIKNKVYKLAAAPFILERKGDYDAAIGVYKNAITILDEATKTFKKGNFLKIHRKMFERQVEVHRERLAYLEDLKRKGNFDGIILPPTILDAMEEVEEEDGKNWSLTQVRISRTLQQTSPGPLMPLNC